MLKYLIPPLLVFVSNIAFAKKSNCDYEMSQLKNIQTMMRKGNYNERTRDIERKLHTKYQNCRKNKNKLSNSNTDHHKTNEQKKPSNKEKIQNYSYPKENWTSTLTNIKGRYQGLKQDGWIKYYKTPNNCFRPKSTAAFAKCLNNRDVEAKKFDAIWAKKNHRKASKLG